MCVCIYNGRESNISHHITTYQHLKGDWKRASHCPTLISHQGYNWRRSIKGHDTRLRSLGLFLGKLVAYVEPGIRGRLDPIQWQLIILYIIIPHGIVPARFYGLAPQQNYWNRVSLSIGVLIWTETILSAYPTYGHPNGWKWLVINPGKQPISTRSNSISWK